MLKGPNHLLSVHRRVCASVPWKVWQLVDMYNSTNVTEDDHKRVEKTVEKDARTIDAGDHDVLVFLHSSAHETANSAKTIDADANLGRRLG